MNTDRAFQEVSRSLCEYDRKLLMNSVQLIASNMEGSINLDGQTPTGVVYRKAGAVAHIIRCGEVNVTLRRLDHCTQVSLHCLLIYACSCNFIVSITLGITTGRPAIKHLTLCFYQQEIPVYFNGNQVFVDPRTLLIKDNFTRVSCSKVYY